MFRRFAILLALLCPAFTAAQSLADAPPVQPLLVDQFLRASAAASPAFSNLQATPLWSTPDGHVLAIVALGDNSIPSKPQSPQIGSAADWQLVDVTNFVTSGLLLSFDRDAAAYATITRGAVLAPLLAPGALLPCTSLADADCSERAAIAHSGLLRVGSTWTILDDLDLDLSYGLGWLRHDTNLYPGAGAPPIDLFGAIGNAQFPTLLIPGLQGADVQNSSLAAAGHWRLDGPGFIDFGASLSRLQLYAPNAPALTSLNQAAVTFGLRHGAFGGVVTGHLLGPSDAFNNPNRWAGLDIGFSWRTPWQGELIFGTQNLWSSGSVPNLGDSGTREIESNQARVPYVQYHQDL